MRGHPVNAGHVVRRPILRRATRLGALAAFLAVAACSGDAPGADSDEGAAQAVAPREIGPADGRDLPPDDLERVAIGDVAPDFTLPSYRGDTLTLSDARGDRDILLVFYRGHW